jgi:hypothetical protein
MTVERHVVARGAAKSIRTAEKHRLENLVSQIGSYHLMEGGEYGVQQALAFIESVNIKYQKILDQEALDAEVLASTCPVCGERTEQYTGLVEFHGDVAWPHCPACGWIGEP